MPFKVKPPLYSVWLTMRSRCNSPRHPNWRHYGGRGIAVCERWNSYELFAADMGPKPSPKHSIERIDNDGNYEPLNCRWATQKEQLRNRRTTVRLVIDGTEHLAMDLAKQSDLKPDTVIARAYRNLSLAEIVSPKRRVFRAGLALGGKANGERQRAKTHCPMGHKYTAENTQIDPRGWRRCRECARLKARRQRRCSAAGA
jgi:hypothetical protein